MPYKDLQRKKEWERRHRPERLARRRELRRIDVAREATEPTSPQPASGADFPWHLLAGGGVLALYNPAFALGAGSLISRFSITEKKLAVLGHRRGDHSSRVAFSAK